MGRGEYGCWIGSRVGSVVRRLQFKAERVGSCREGVVVVECAGKEGEEASSLSRFNNANESRNEARSAREWTAPAPALNVQYFLQRFGMSFDRPATEGIPEASHSPIVVLGIGSRPPA